MAKAKARTPSSKSSRKTRMKPKSCKQPTQCPHEHFRYDPPDRRGIAKDKHINILATPKGYRWEDVKKEDGDGEKPVKRTPTTTKRLCPDRYVKKPEKAYIHNFLAEVWSFLTPGMADRLKNMLMHEFSMSDREADEFIFNQREANIVNSSTVSLYKKPRDIGDGKAVLDSVIKLRSPNKMYCDKYPKSNIGIRNSWIKDLSDLVSDKMADYVLDTMTAERTERQQEIAQTLLNHFNNMLEQKASLANPKTQTHKTMVLVADRLSLWLDKNVPMSKVNEQRLKDIEEALERKKMEDERRQLLKEEQKTARDMAGEEGSEQSWEEEEEEEGEEDEEEEQMGEGDQPPTGPPGQPGTKPEEPEAQSGEPGAQFGEPSEVQIGEPGAQHGQPGEAQAVKPGTQTGESVAQQEELGAEQSELSEAQTRDSGLETEEPGSQPGESKAQLGEPGPQPGEPESQPGEPVSQPGEPVSQPGASGAQLGESGAQLQEPGSQSWDTEAQSREPGEAQLGDPGVQVEEGGVQQHEFGDQPGETGGAQPGEPGIEQGEPVTQPGAQLLEPESQPSRAQPEELGAGPAETGVPGADTGTSETVPGGSGVSVAELGESGTPGAQPAEMGTPGTESREPGTPGAEQEKTGVSKPPSLSIQPENADMTEPGASDQEKLADESKREEDKDREPSSAKLETPGNEIQLTPSEIQEQSAAEAQVEGGPQEGTSPGDGDEITTGEVPQTPESAPEQVATDDARNLTQPPTTSGDDEEITQVAGSKPLDGDEMLGQPEGTEGEVPADGKPIDQEAGETGVGDKQGPPARPGEDLATSSGAKDLTPEQQRQKSIIENVASKILETPIEETPRQEAIKDILGKHLEREMGDEDRPAIDQVSSRVGTWIDKIVDQVETEYGDRRVSSAIPSDRRISPVSQKAKGRIFVLKKVDERKGYDVDLISNTRALEKIRMARGKSPARAKVPNPDAALEPADLKSWARWASAVSEMAQSWAEWIEDTVQEAQKRGELLNTDNSPERLKEWDEFRGNKAQRAQQWRKTKEEVEQTASLWSQKGMKSKELKKS